jgi:hypothetical protein
MRSASIRNITLTIFILLLLPVLATAQQESKVIRVRFAKGATSRTYEGSVSHSTNTYLVKARKGQTMSIIVSSPDNHAVFSISQQLEPDTDPIEIISDRKKWTSRLSTTGDYDISVGAERSVATYTITITVK